MRPSTVSALPEQACRAPLDAAVDHLMPQARFARSRNPRDAAPRFLRLPSQRAVAVQFGFHFVGRGEVRTRRSRA